MPTPDISMSDSTKAAMILRALITYGRGDPTAVSAVIAILEPRLPDPGEREAFEAAAGLAREQLGENALADMGYLEDTSLDVQWRKAMEAWLTTDLMAQVMEASGLGPDEHLDSAGWFMRAMNVRRALLERI